MIFITRSEHEKLLAEQEFRLKCIQWMPITQQAPLTLVEEHTEQLCIIDDIDWR